MAKIYIKSGEHVLINGIRQAFQQKFTATRWVDLRVGFLLSLTSSGADDTITGLTEEIDSGGGIVPWTDRVSIGITDLATKSVFLGYSNSIFGPTQDRGNTKLVSSDAGIGTTNTNFWRYVTEIAPTTDTHPSVKIIDSGLVRAPGLDGSQLHLVQDTTGAGGYATLVALRFQRGSFNSSTISMSVKTTGASHNGDILYTNTPSASVLETNLNDFPDTVQQLGPVQLSHAPDAIWMYWPFHSSRLRVHAYGILRSGSG